MRIARLLDETHVSCLGPQKADREWKIIVVGSNEGLALYGVIPRRFVDREGQRKGVRPVMPRTSARQG